MRWCQGPGCALKTLILAALLTAQTFPAFSDEAWTYKDRPNCDDPIIVISEERGTIERMDFACTIKGKSGGTYVAECLTDAPSVEPIRITVTPIDASSAVIKWDNVDTDTYMRCGAEPNATM